MQLDHNQLRDLIALLGESDIQELKLEGDDFRLELRRNLPSTQPQVLMQTAPAAIPAPVAAAPAARLLLPQRPRLCAAIWWRSRRRWWPPSTAPLPW